MADRVEREIEEILKKIDDFVPDRGRQRREPRKVSSGFSNAQGWFARRLAAISLNQVMLWSLVLFVAAFFLRGIPGASWIMIGGLIVFATAFVLSLRAPGGARRGPEKRWRGQPINDSGLGWPDRIKAMIKGNKKKPR
jgi:hypothetical protein